MTSVLFAFLCHQCVTCQVSEASHMCNIRVMTLSLCIVSFKQNFKSACSMALYRLTVLPHCFSKRVGVNSYIQARRDVFYDLK